MTAWTASLRERAGKAVSVADDNFLLFTVAGIGFSVSFQTIAHLARTHGLPGWPPLYPVGIDVGILALVREARRLMTLKRSDFVPRVLAWALTGFTIYVNVHGSPAHDWLGRALHVVMPCLWVVFLELTRRRALASRVEARDKVPAARWLLAPLSTFFLWRRMVLWQVTSYGLALEREQVRRRTIARLRAAHGDRWRDKADSAVVWQLRHGIDVEGAAAATEAAAAAATPVPSGSRQPTRRKPRQDGATRRVSPRDRAAKYESDNPGASAADVAAHAGVSKRTVERWREQASGKRPDLRVAAP